MLKKKENYLITHKEWFTAPDGQAYKAIFGNLLEIGKEFFEIGNMHIKKTDVICSIRTDLIPNAPYMVDVVYEGEITQCKSNTRIYNANKGLEQLCYLKSFATEEKQ